MDNKTDRNGSREKVNFTGSEATTNEYGDEHTCVHVVHMQHEAYGRPSVHVGLRSSYILGCIYNNTPQMDTEIRYRLD
jgi:hypothetical protein